MSDKAAGRPPVYTKPRKTVHWQLDVELVKRIPKPQTPWVTEAIREKLARESGE